MSKWPYRRAESTGNFDRTRALPRTRRYGRRTVEQTRSVDIRDLRKAAYVGEAEGNWLDARNKLFCAGVQPKHWNDAAITLDGQMLPVTWVGWHFGGRRPFSCAYAAEGCCSYLLHAATPGDVGNVIT
jgi:hypothetical protein